MNTGLLQFFKACALALVFMMSSCSRPIDLDTPCPDYGKRCPQALINT